MSTLTDLQVALVGGGNMGRGLIGGLLGKGLDPSRLCVADADPATCERLQRDFGVRTTGDAGVAVTGANVVVMAVKPQQMPQVLQGLQAALAVSKPLVVSVAAGLRVADLARWAGPGIAVVRSMPNRPALVGAGATGLHAGADVTAIQRALAETVMGATGLCVWVDEESQIDLVTALSGSGPAYFFRLGELMAEAAIARGMAPAVARALAAQTLAGAGQLVAAEPDDDLGRMRAEVTSKGGTTEAALKVFAEGGLDNLVGRAMDAAAARGAELADLLGKA
jgi:pyrroline-5-carboxylate reductase